MAFEKDDKMLPEEIAHMKAELPFLNVEEGLAYSMNSRALYLDILQDYINAEQETALEECLERGDMRGYELIIHELKGTSRLVGLKQLGELAEALQFAAEKKDAAFIQEHHPAFLAQYLEAKEKLGRLMN